MSSRIASLRNILLCGSLLGSSGLMLNVAPVMAQTAPPSSQVRASQTQSYSIAAQPLDSALTRIADQGGVRLFFASDAISGVRSQAVSGQMSVEAALSQALAGTGFSWRYRETGVVIIEKVPVAGEAIQLGAIRVEGANDVARGGDTGGAAYSSAASVAHISREQIERVAPVSAGDMFKSTPGVVSTGSRAGLGLNLNIRGLQGMNRVATLIDGTQQSTSGYIGYRGQTSSVFVDPDFISGVDITKGPSDGPLGNGAMGGVVNMRTLGIDDLLSDGQTYGFQIKAGAGTNTVTSPAGATVRHDKPSSISSGNSWNGSVAGAFRAGRFEGMLALSQRETGNYLAGKKGVAHANSVGGNMSPVPPGAEVFDTSEDIFSAILKGRARISDSLTLDLGYIRYENKHGELNDFAYVYSFISPTQGTLGRTETDTYSARLTYAPADSDLVNLKAHLWRTDVKRVPYGIAADQTEVRTIGLEIYNVSTFAEGRLPVTYGAQVSVEDADNPEIWQQIGSTTYLAQSGPAGKRRLSSLFARADYAASDFLNLSAGLRVDHYNLKQGGGVLAAFGNQSATRVNPTLSASLQPWEGIYFHAQYSGGWRPPALRESSFQLGEILYPNPDLKPETAENFELGASYLRAGLLSSEDNFQLKISYFNNDYNDYIIRDSIKGDWSEPRHWTNIDKATFKGYDVSLRYDLRNYYIEGDFTKYTDIAFCHRLTGCLEKGLGIDYGSNYIPPEYNLTVTVGARLFDEKLNIGTRFNHFGERAVTGMTGGYVTPTYWPSQLLIDLFGSYKLSENLKVNLSVSNLTDRYYLDPLALTRAPAPGRTIRLSLSSRFGDGAPEPKVSGGYGRQDANRWVGPSLSGAFDGNWAGFYAGAHVGGGWVDTKGTTTTGDGTAASAESARFKAKGIAGGLQAGYNHQFSNNWVVGIEGDFSPINLSGYENILATQSPALITNKALQAMYRYEFSDMVTLRGRLGYSFGRTLVYGTAGIAQIREAQIRTQYQSTSASANAPNGTQTEAYVSEKVRITRTGSSLGGGLQYALDNHWSIKADYVYSDFGSKALNFVDGRLGVGRTYSVSTILRDPVTNVALRDPVTNAILRETTVYPGTADTVNGRIAKNKADVQSLRIGINYRF
ncbi:MAG: TonB-dependent receptor [Asticcacaulis sp.]